jgi:hypothetical protein
MPPLVSHKVDDTGTQKLADWIDALPPRTQPRRVDSDQRAAVGRAMRSTSGRRNPVGNFRR